MFGGNQSRRYWGHFILFVMSLALALPGLAFAEAPILKGLSSSEKARINKMVAAAEKEGELVFITNTLGPDLAQPLFEDFKKQYGLKKLRLGHSMKRAGAVISTVKKDITAKQHRYDVVQVGSHLFYEQLLKRKALQKYDSPNFKNFIPQVTGEASGAYARKGYFISTQVNVYGIVWNTKFVKKDIKSWEDVLDPKYKGRIIISDLGKAFITAMAYGGLRDSGVLSRSYFEKLAKLDPIYILSMRSHVRKVVSGEKWIAVLSSPLIAYKAALKGAPVKSVIPQGKTVLVGYPLGILAKAKHPNAAKLWIDYLHSPRGHQKYLDGKTFATGLKSAKITSFAAKFVPPISKLDTIPMDWSKVTPKKVKAWQAEFREIFQSKKN